MCSWLIIQFFSSNQTRSDGRFHRSWAQMSPDKKMPKPILHNWDKEECVSEWDKYKACVSAHLEDKQLSRFLEADGPVSTSIGVGAVLMVFHSFSVEFGLYYLRE